MQHKFKMRRCNTKPIWPWITGGDKDWNNLKSREVAWIFIPPYILSRAAQNRLLVKFVSRNIFLSQVDFVSASRNISSLRWRGSMMRRALPCWTTSMLTARSVALASPHHHHHYNCHCHYYRCYHDCILKMGRLTSLTRCGTTLPATTRSGSSARTPTSWWTLPSRPARSTPPESRTSPPLFIRLFIFVPTPSSETAGDILQKFWEFSNKFYPVKILVNWISLLSKRGPRARLLTNPKILSNFPSNHFKQLWKLPWQMSNPVHLVLVNYCIWPLCVDGN